MKHKMLLLCVLVSLAGAAGCGAKAAYIQSMNGDEVRRWENVTNIYFDRDDRWCEFVTQDNQKIMIVGDFTIGWYPQTNAQPVSTKPQNP